MYMLVDINCSEQCQLNSAGLDSRMPEGRAHTPQTPKIKGVRGLHTALGRGAAPARGTPSTHLQRVCIGVQPRQTGVLAMHACPEGVQSMHALWTGVHGQHTFPFEGLT